jgi:hypothetical protein
MTVSRIKTVQAVALYALSCATGLAFSARKTWRENPGAYEHLTALGSG